MSRHLQTDNTNYRVPSVERAMAIIDRLAAHPGSNLSQLATHLGVTVNGVFRICQVLVSLGHLDRDDHDKTYRLSPKFLSLGHQSMASNSLVGASIDLLRLLRDEIGETAAIATRADLVGVVLECLPAMQPFHFRLEPGTRFELYSSAPGKALLAFLPEQERARLCRQQKLVRSTSRTIITQAALEAELVSVHLQGWAQDLAEAIEGCHCVGAPVFDQRRYPVGAIWVCGPANRLERRRFPEVAERVMACARSISRRLSGEAMDIPASIRKG
jgi:DNA-binding IclR family transcriptional regulator